MEEWDTEALAFPGCSELSVLTWPLGGTIILSVYSWGYWSLEKQIFLCFWKRRVQSWIFNPFKPILSIYLYIIYLSSVFCFLAKKKSPMRCPCSLFLFKWSCPRYVFTTPQCSVFSPAFVYELVSYFWVPAAHAAGCSVSSYGWSSTSASLGSCLVS